MKAFINFGSANLHFGAKKLTPSDRNFNTLVRVGNYCLTLFYVALGMPHSHDFLYHSSAARQVGKILQPLSARGSINKVQRMYKPESMDTNHLHTIRTKLKPNQSCILKSCRSWYQAAHACIWQTRLMEQPDNIID